MITFILQNKYNDLHNFFKQAAYFEYELSDEKIE